jgi:long-chain acyl-CoA synthetase
MATASLLRPVAERITGATTLGRMILSASERGEDLALRYRSGEVFHTITYRELGERARRIACGLIALGVEQGDSVAILCSTRAEWTLCEAGILCAGAVVVPVYHTNSAEECEHVLTHSAARVLFCEDAPQLEKIERIRERCPRLEHVVVIEGSPSGAMPLAELCDRGREIDAEQIETRVRDVAPDDVATIVYTSGSTGPPKGCMLTHGNFLSATAMIRSQLELDDVQPVIYMFLPLAHVLARIAQTVVIDVGGTLVYWRGDSKRIIEEIAEARPTHLVAVPRVYEKLHTGVVSAIEERAPVVRGLFAWALEVGRRARSVRGRELGPLAAARLRLADRVALAKVRSLFGPALKFALVGAAPIDRGLLEFFNACGVLVLEGYGLTESCAAATLNPRGAPCFGTVGRALPDSEIMVTEDGEVLLRGPQVFVGYHEDPAATAAAFSDGWLYTGDTGSLSGAGYLTLTGRKKELIITSSGKNISPVGIESALRETRWINEAVVYGDRRPYLVALVTLDPDEAPKLAAQLGIADDLASMSRDEGVHAALEEDVAAVNSRLATIEQIKRFGVLDHNLTQAAGELTPTLKVKRALVYERYTHFFEELYAGRR